MSNWRRWVRPGLAATIVLAFFAVLLRSGAVERDIAARVSDRLNADGFDWARVMVFGRGVEIDGVAPTPELQKEAVASASAVAGVASVVNRSGLLPVASPYVWSAKRTGRTVTLDGNVPSEANRNSVLAAARRALPDAEILDNSHLARGASPAFNSATAFALERLADLSDGLVTITDGTLAVAGVADTSERYTAARKALTEAIPAGVTLGPVDIAPPRADPFVWSASLDEGAVTLAGFVPNDVVKSELADEARSVLPGVTIIDNMNIASGEPKGFADAAKFAITALGRLKGGGVMLDGLTLDVAGVARSVDDYEAVVGGIGGDLPPGLEIVANSITPAPVSDYGWSGKRDGDTVTLSGYVPSLQDRAEVQQVADELFAGASVTDGVRVAAGEPKMDWIGAVKFAMGQLAELHSGSVVLGDKTYSIEGEAANSKATWPSPASMSGGPAGQHGSGRIRHLGAARLALYAVGRALGDGYPCRYAPRPAMRRPFSTLRAASSDRSRSTTRSVSQAAPPRTSSMPPSAPCRRRRGWRAAASRSPTRSSTWKAPPPRRGDEADRRHCQGHDPRQLQNAGEHRHPSGGPAPGCR